MVAGVIPAIPTKAHHRGSIAYETAIGADNPTPAQLLLESNLTLTLSLTVTVTVTRTRICPPASIKVTLMVRDTVLVDINGQGYSFSRH